MTRKTFLIIAMTFFIVIIMSIVAYGGIQTNWYAVAPWELEVCSKWGGTSEAQQSSTMHSAEIYLSQLTLTLQGKKTIYPDNSSLYELAWYIQPAQGSIQYEVIAYDENNITNIYSVDGATVSGNSMFGGGGYRSFYTDETYTRLKMTYGSEYLDVPIVGTES